MNCKHGLIHKFTLLEGSKVPFDTNGVCYYYINNQTSKLSAEDQWHLIFNSFEDWNFHLYNYGKQFIYTDDKEKAYCQIYWVFGDTGAKPSEPELATFLNDPNTMAYSVENTGKIYISDNIDWSNPEIDLRIPLAHEIGHMQTIGHTNKPHDIMNPSLFEMTHGMPEGTDYFSRDTLFAIHAVYSRSTKSFIQSNYIELIIISLLSFFTYLIIKA